MEARLSKIKVLFDVLLLFVNTVGIVGALTEVLRIPCARADWKVFWGALFLFCGVSVLFWSGRKVRLRHLALCGVPYVLLAAVFWKELLGGLLLGVAGAVENLNEKYQFRITLPSAAALLRKAGWEQGSEKWLITISILCLLLPFVMFTAYLLSRGWCLWLWAGNALWLVAACTFNRFPDYFYLAFCVLGLVAALVQKDFGDSPAAGGWAAVWAAVLSGGVLAFTYHHVVPLTDQVYQENRADRAKFYRMVNEDLIPEVQGFLADLGLGSFGPGQGADVTGALHRQNLISYTWEELYRVTVDALPQEAVYLKCFVGAVYGEEEWSPYTDRELERYYRDNNLSLPENYNSLVNINFDALRRIRGGGFVGHMQVEEMGPQGSYSVYPYGAKLTEDFKVHADGSVERRDREYGFDYRSVWGLDSQTGIPGLSDPVEEQYRQYVHESFLDYPADLELFWQSLEEEGIRDGSIYNCAWDIMRFLDRRAEYDLEAESNPPQEDFVEYFLFQSHRGYCVHFASAGVLALRYFGIPARYVTGYMLSPWDFKRQQDGTYTAAVTGKQAHAWAEVYLDGAGWVPVEMTPGAMASAPDRREEQMQHLMETEAGWEQALATQGPPREERAAPTPEAAVPAQGEAVTGGVPTPVPSWEPEQDSGTDPKGPADRKEGDAFGGGSSSSGAVFRLLRAAAVLGGALLAGFFLILMAGRLRARAEGRWSRMLQAAGARARVLLLYRNFRRVLRVAGCPEELEVGEEPFLQRFRGIFPECSVGEYEDFCGILEKATFGKEEPSPEEVGRVSRLHDSMVRKVYESTPLYKRPLFGLFRCRRQGLCVRGGEEKCW